jgi:hypothetical protein
MEGDKLKVLVSMDVDCDSARIEVKGNVDSRNVQALHAVARRVNTLMPGLGIVLDLAAASATREAAQELRECADAQALPAGAGQDPVPCNLSAVLPVKTAQPARSAEAAEEADKLAGASVASGSDVALAA